MCEGFNEGVVNQKDVEMEDGLSNGDENVPDLEMNPVNARMNSHHQNDVPVGWDLAVVIP